LVSFLSLFSLFFAPDTPFLIENRDFGLARYYEESYKASSKGLIPVRWAAPEVIRQEPVTSKSDVFSFGVCMWEILEKGKRKFIDTILQCVSSSQTTFAPSSSGPWFLNTNAEVAEAVLEGQRLTQPKNCPEELFVLMMKCWKPNPDERPSFRALLTELLLVAHLLVLLFSDYEKDPLFYKNAKLYEEDPLIYQHDSDDSSEANYHRSQEREEN
jgi:serine/threonine protein kinase